MYLIQIFLPMYGNRGEKFPASYYQEVRDRLVDQYGGITAYTRSPAQGMWQPEEGKTVQDDLVIYEVMVEELDRTWWDACKTSLEQQFQQEAVIIRAQAIYLL